MNTQLDTFTRSYIETALWSSTGGKYGECPCCGKVAVLDRWPEEEFEQEEVCYECGPREMNCEPPLDRNYSFSDLAPETLEKMIADCRDFQSSFGDYIASDLERAGHNFWLTRNGHGAGFWDGDWEEPYTQLGEYHAPVGIVSQYQTVGDYLTAMSHAYGSADLYVGDDGKIYIQ